VRTPLEGTDSYSTEKEADRDRQNPPRDLGRFVKAGRSKHGLGLRPIKNQDEAARKIVLEPTMPPSPQKEGAPETPQL